jgi:hypothetical protein
MLRRAGPGIAWRSSVPRDVLGYSRPILGAVAGDLDAAMGSPERCGADLGGARGTTAQGVVRRWQDDGKRTGQRLRRPGRAG